MKNESAKKQWRFLVVWSILNLLGWVIGFIFVFTIMYNLLSIKQFALAHGWVPDFRRAEWPGEAALVWFPFGLSIGILQWVKLRHFGINLFVWAFVTAIGCSFLATLYSWAFNVEGFGGSPNFSIITIVLFWIRNNFSFWLRGIGFGSIVNLISYQHGRGVVAILIGVAIIGALQAVFIRKHVPRQELWIRAYILGLLAPTIIALLTISAKSLLLKFCYFFHLYSFVSLRWESFLGFLIIITSISISIFTGNVLLKQSNTDSVPYLVGERLAVKSAFVGSIVFGFMSLVDICVRTYLWVRNLMDRGVPLDGINFLGKGVLTDSITNVAIVSTIIIVLLAIAFAYFPARFMGGRLANSLAIDAHNHILSKRSAILKGTWFGAIAGCITCVPLWVLELLNTPFTGGQKGVGLQVGIIFGLFLSGEIIVIASIAGGWTGKRLERFISR